MNNTVNLSELISRLATLTDTDTNTTRLFVREFFATVREALENGEEVEIKDFGTFRRSDDPVQAANGTVLFAPAPALAAEVNKPFAAFEPVVLSDGFDPDNLTPSDLGIDVDEHEEDVSTAAEKVEIPEAEEVPVFTDDALRIDLDNEEESTAVPAARLPVEEDIEAPEPADVPAGTPVHDEAPAEETAAPAAVAAPPVPSFPEDDEEDEEEPDTEPERKSHAWIWWIAAACIIGCAGGYFAAMGLPVSTSDVSVPAADSIAAAAEVPAETATPQQEVSQAPVAAEEAETGNSPAGPESAPAQTNPAPAQTNPAPAQAATENVYETVSPTNYLSIMARRHYGAQVYWVYIYEANASKLGHPDRIAPGTRVRIPDRSTIPGIGTPAGIRAAEAKSREIRRRFE